MRARLAPPTLSLAIVVAALVLACSSAPQPAQSTPAPTREPNTVSVSVLLDLSGSRAPSGQPQRNAMQLWLDAQQPQNGVRLKVKFVDVGGSAARLFLELRRAVVEDHADAVVIGVPVVVDDAFAQAVQVASVPVILTLPASEPAATVAGRWMFVLAATPDAIARAVVTDMQDRGVIAPMLLATDDAATSAQERAAFGAELKRRDLMTPTPVLLTSADGPDRVRAAAAVAKSMVLVAPTAPYADVLRSIPVSPSAPRVYLSYLTETADLTNLRDQSSLVTWPGSRSLATISTPLQPGPRALFVQSFTERHGAPSTLAATAYDALGILQSAAGLAPSELDAPRLRLRLETLTFAGVVTTYAFTFTRHAGFTASDLALLRWNAQRSAPFIAPAPEPEIR